MSSLTRGGPGIAPGKHPTAERLWREERKLVCDRCGQSLDWDPRKFYSEEEIAAYKANPDTRYVCEPCLNAMPDASQFFGGGVFNSEGEAGQIVPGESAG